MLTMKKRVVIYSMSWWLQHFKVSCVCKTKIRSFIIMQIFLWMLYLNNSINTYFIMILWCFTD